MGRPPKNLNKVEESAVGTVVNQEEMKELAVAVEESAEPTRGAEPEYNLEVIKDTGSNIDIFMIAKKDPRYEYRFLNIKDTNLSIKTGNLLHAKGGWQLCEKEHCLRIGIKPNLINSNDGRYHVLDTVLAFMPKEQYREKEKERQRKSKERMNDVMRRAKEGEAVGNIHESMRGLQSAKQLGMKSD